MEQLRGHSFKLKKGDYVLMRKKEIAFDNFIKSYVGVIRDYDGVRSKSGCLLKTYIIYHLSGEIVELSEPNVFAWYKGGFMILGDFGRNDYSKNIYINLSKMSKKEILEFKSKRTKLKILKSIEEK